MRLLMSCLICCLCLHAFAAPRCEDIFPPLISFEDLDSMSKEGRSRSRDKVFREPFQRFFVRVLHQPQEHLASLQSGELLTYLSLFANWRILPPDDWSLALMNHLAPQIRDWSSKNFLTFANLRKAMPLEFPDAFLQAYHQVLLEKFNDFGRTTQLEVLAAELYHRADWILRDLQFYLETLTLRLQSNPEPLSLKSIKDMHRALQFLPQDQRTALSKQISQLVEALEKQLQSQGLSLTNGGTSGSDYLTQSNSSDFRRFSLEMDLRALFPSSTFEYEYSDPLRIGFFDPVDLLLVESRLIVEWDGPHHYFRQINTEGTLSSDHESLFLRPLDRIKDRVLREQGYRILRISPPLANQIDSLDLPTLIIKQNE